jgi:hypothetical protein
MRSWNAVLILSVTACRVDSGASAQREIVLGNPTGRMEVMLKGTNGISEVSKERVWVNGGNNAGEYVLLDFASHTASQPLRRGQGPGELGGQPMGILRVGGDSAYIQEVLRGSLYVIEGAGIVGTIREDNPAIVARGRDDLAWADRAGHIGAVRKPPIHMGDYLIGKRIPQTCFATT